MIYNFDIEKNQTTFGVPFDYESIMMYQWNAFAKDPNKATIVAKKPVADKTFTNEKLSKNDIAAVNAMYKCQRN